MFLIRYFLSGKGLSFRTGKYFGQAVLVGIFAGFVVVGFRYLIDLGYEWIFGSAGRVCRFLLIVV